MKILQAEKEILTALVNHPDTVMVLDDAGIGTKCIVLNGRHGYFIPSDALWLNTEKIEKHASYRSIVKFVPGAINKIEMTDEFIEQDGALLRKFIGHGGDYVLLPEAQLKNFTFAAFFQERGMPKGPVLVTELDFSGADQNVGLVMPVRLKDEEY